jgi:hypothetical protein
LARQKNQEYANRLERWQGCCPGGDETLARIRYEKAVPESKSQIPVPPVFGENSGCESAFGYEGMASLRFGYYSFQRERYWGDEYAGYHQSLYDCCVTQFNACLGKVAQSGGTPGEIAASAASEQCLRQFSPEYQEQTAAKSGDGQTVPTGFAVIAAWPEGTGSFELGLLTAAAALIGFICGRAGRRRRWARLGSRVINALFAGLVFLGVALLPDTQPRSLLLALAGAIIVTLLRLLLRSFFLLRQREQNAPVP